MVVRLSKADRYDDGFAFLWGAIPIGAGVLAMVVSGPIFVVSRNRLGELGEPQRRILRVRPSLSAGARGGQAGLALDLRFERSTPPRHVDVSAPGAAPRDPRSDRS